VSSRSILLGRLPHQAFEYCALSDRRINFGGVGEAYVDVHQPVKQQVALWFLGAESVQHHNGEHACPSSCSCALNRVIGLRTASAGDKHVRSCPKRLANEEVQLARFVSSESKAGQVFAFYENLDPAERGRKTRHFIDGGREAGHGEPG
jgi:hypothetical protein